MEIEKVGGEGSHIHRGLTLLCSKLPDHWMLYYNGGVDFMLVAHGNGAVNVVAQERYEAFVEGLCQK